MAGKPSWYWNHHSATLAHLAQQHRDPMTGIIDWERVRDALPRRADGSKLTTDAVRMQYKKLVQSGTATGPATGHGPPIVQVAPPPPPRDPLEVERERQDRVRKLKEERDLLQAVAGEHGLRSKLERLAERVALRYAPPPPRKALAAARGDVTEDELHLHLSDWHYGEEVDGERTRGFNAYNTVIARRRVHAIVGAAASIVDKMQRGGGWRFPRLVVAVNGDLVSGTIHEVERHSDALNIVEAVYECGMLLASAVRDLASLVPSVTVYCTSGNHGRLPDARRVQQKDPLRSWDTLVAYFAREHLRAATAVEWVIPNSYAVSYQVAGWNFLQQHGHDVKSWNSIPYYGMNRMVSSLNALEASRGGTLHYICLGHFHGRAEMPHASGEFFVNGSLIGGTEFSVNALGKSDQPKQTMVGVHREHGVTHRWPLIAGAGVEGEGYELPNRRAA